MAVYASLTRAVWGVLVASLIVGCAMEPTNVIARILNTHWMIYLGKLTFSAFLVHTAVIRFLLGGIRKPIHLTHVAIVSFVHSQKLLKSLIIFS